MQDERRLKPSVPQNDVADQSPSEESLEFGAEIPTSKLVEIAQKVINERSLENDPLVMRIARHHNMTPEEAAEVLEDWGLL